MRILLLLIQNYKMEKLLLIISSEELVSVPTKSEAIKIIFKLNQLFKDHDDIQYLSKLEDKILNQRNRTKQTAMSHF